jgi:DnaJ-class molecular chaperone
VRRHVRITLDEQLRGARVELQITRTEYCSVCGGSGTREVRAVTARSGYMRPGSVGFRPRCAERLHGLRRRGVTQSKCAACAGNGTIARKRGHLFDIPAGSPGGSAFRAMGGAVEAGGRRRPAYQC